MSPQRLCALLLTLFINAHFAGAAPIYVTCVGDSITAGVGVTTPALQSYPAKLQQLIGSNYTIVNCGVSGTTLLTNGDMPYIKSSAYSLSGVGKIVVIMLGSNDSKPQNWAYGTNFYSNYAAFIASYTNLATHPRVVLCTPPPVFNTGAVMIDPTVVASQICPLVRQLGTNLNLQVIDLQVLLAGHPEWFPDNVHPNSQGTAVMAAIVYSALAGDTLNEAIPSLVINPSTAKNNVVSWPSTAAGWVLQTTPGPLTSNLWSIASQPAVTDGTLIHETNSTGIIGYYRLWWPSH